MSVSVPPLPAPPGEQVFVERFPEPITGWVMVGAGASWTAGTFPESLEVEIRYDGEPRVRADVRAPEPGRYEFGLHAPAEPDARRLTVALLGGGVEVTLFDGAIADLKDRGAAPAPDAPPARPMPRWLSPVVTLGKSLASGECFSASWWGARVTRYRAMVTKARQRVRDKLMIRERFAPWAPHDAYVARTALSPDDLRAMTDRAARFRFKPTFSILCPVYNVDPKWLRAAVGSVLAQAYPHWELCLADDASTDPATRAALDQLPRDPRIKLVRRPENGHICAATNSAADLATGEFVALMDNDDELAPHALFAVAEFLQSHPDADLIYSDEDKIDAAGHRCDPQFKPDWSPELLLSYNYVNHFTVVRRTVFEKVGRFRAGYEGSQDHDLLLRATERTDRVHHVPQILYHWRALDTSTAAAAGVKTYVHTAGRQAVEDARTRRKLAASLYVPPFAEKLGLPILGLDGPDRGPTVAVVVRGTAADAARTVRAIKQTTTYANYTTYLVIDAAVPADALNRIAAGRSEDFLLFLEAGIEPADPRWLSRLMTYLRIPGVGAAGGLILTGDGRIASAGTVLGAANGAAPADAFGGIKPEPVSYYFYAEVARDVSAPGRGCLLTPRAVFDRAGGFDADRFGQTLYDVDYALRLAGLGLRAVHVGGAELKWTGPDAARAAAPAELRALRAAHGSAPDPYYNPNLSPWDSFAPRPDAPHLVPATPAAPVRVLFATHNLTAYEGAPKIIQDVAVDLTRRRIVAGAVYAPAAGRAAAAYEAAGIPVHAPGQATPLPYAKRFIDGQWTPAEYETAQRDLGRLLREVKPRVVVANTLGMFPLVEAAARHGIPGILAIQESYPEPLFARAFSPYGRWRCERAFLFADRVIFASRSCAALYARLDGRKNFEVIHNGLSAGPFDAFQRATSKGAAVAQLPGPADKTNGRLRVVAVGTVCERKAQHVLVEAAALVARKRRDLTCYLVGAREGLPYLSYVRNLIRSRGLEDVVVPVGETDNVWTFLRAADVFVCASYVEAFSLSVLEAEAFSLPVVSTPCGGLDEQVVWGRSALKFDFGRADQLADHLLKLAEAPAYRAEMGRQSRAAFDLALTAAGMTDRYARAILAAARVPAGVRADQAVARAA
ncbi:glycosyltransferase [Fimbriiglobus ruber]|uniref:Glycosyl transferase, group 2 family protein n=1 Tax=Fimbriiglobus ruber TaxID=1908690 RepID=A0A225DW49_9BACT|nr:glycosyltransferase [Fimbriiglobus ruber]OWK45273.1 Glycosyl transferase, group 2 family protein [Fimbriiglobus ruber]